MLSQGLVLTIILLLVVGMVAQVSRQIFRFERKWFEARAVAETAKSMQWQYATASAGFETEDDSARNLVEQVTFARSRYTKTLGLVDAAKLEDETTDTMKHLRRAPWEQQREVYIKERVLDQSKWYLAKAKRNQQLSTVYAFAATLLQGAGVVIAVVGFLEVSFGASVLLTIIATTISSLIGWAQSRRYDELVEPYEYSHESLEEIAKTMEDATTKQEFLGLVEETERLVSREHQMWQWRRGLNLEKFLQK